MTSAKGRPVRSSARRLNSVNDRSDSLRTSRGTARTPKIPDDDSGRIANLRQVIRFAKLVAHPLIDNDALHGGLLGI
jgi:hypothetical protein